MKKSYMKNFCLTGVLLLFSAICYGQTKVKGVVKSADDDKPLPGVSVSVKGTKITVSTDENGYYLIEVPKNGTLIFSSVGFINEVVNVNNRTTINVSLKTDLKDLNEVVVVGYGTQKKANLTGSVSTVSDKELTNRPVTSVANALQGTMPGLTIVSNNGQPGKDAGNITIRGRNLNNTGAMVVIDGVITSAGDLSLINPDDIESISVLKDANSAAIYGNRAAGGVILVTTKKGKKGSAQITYTNLIGKNTPVKLPDYLPAWQAASLYNQALQNEGNKAIYTEDQIQKFKDGSDPYNYPNTDWLKLIYTGKGGQQNHFIGINGGSDKNTYALSMGYFTEDGIIPRTNAQRYTGRLNINSQIKDNLSAFAYLSYIFKPVAEPYGLGNIIRQTNRISPIIPAYYENGHYGSIGDGSPLAMLNSPGFKNQKEYSFQGSVGLDWEAIKGLHIKPSFNYRTYASKTKDFNSSIQYYNKDGSNKGNPNVSNIKDEYSDYVYIAPQLIVEYQKNIGDHEIKALAGVSQEYQENYYLSGYRRNFLNNSLYDLDAAPVDGQTTSNYSYETALRSNFYRVNYSYQDKYLLEANLRFDGSSRFAPGKRWGVFPGVSAGWNIAQENFYHSLKSIVPYLKLRAGWGKLGNQSITGTKPDNQNVPPGIYPTIPTINTGLNYPFNNAVAGGIAPEVGVDPAIVWEESVQTNIGLDAVVFKSFSLTVDYFIKQAKGVLYQSKLPVMYGLKEPFVNGSSYENRGWEFTLGYQAKTGDFNWNVTGNAAFIKNKVIKLGATDAPEIEKTNITQVGQPINSFYGYIAEGIFQNQAQVDAHPSQKSISPRTGPGDLMYKDMNGDGKIDADDRVVLGSNFPKVTYGLNISLSWKQFDFVGFLQGAAGVKNYIGGVALGTNGNSTGKPTPVMLDSWSPSNPNGSFPRAWINSGQNNPEITTSSFWVKDASYLRLKNVQLGYTLPGDWLKPVGIKKLRLYYSGQNLLTFTKFYKWIDPEAPQGTSGSNYPQVKIHSFGLNVSF